MFTGEGTERILIHPDIVDWDGYDPTEPTYADYNEDGNVTVQQLKRSLFDSTFVRPKPVTILDLPVVITKLAVQYEELEQDETALPLSYYPHPRFIAEGMILPSFGDEKSVVRVRMILQRNVSAGRLTSIFMQRIRPPGEPPPNIAS